MNAATEPASDPALASDLAGTKDRAGGQIIAPTGNLAGSGATAQSDFRLPPDGETVWQVIHAVRRDGEPWRVLMQGSRRDRHRGSARH